MVNQQLLEYVRQQLGSGVSVDEIKKSLAITGGWNAQDITEAFAVSATPMSGPTTMPPAMATNTSVRLSTAKWLVVCASMATLFVFAASAAAYYIFFVTPSSPASILEKAFETSVSPSSFSFAATSTGELATTPKGDQTLAANFTFTMQGSLDRQVVDNPAFDATFGGNLSTNTATDTGAANFLLHSIYANKKIYLNLNNFSVSYKSTDPKEAAAQFVVAIANGLAASLENKWIEIDATNTPLTTSSPALTADWASFAAYARGTSYLVSVQNAGMETINNTPTYHLVLVLRFEQQLADILLNISADQNATKADAPNYANMKALLASQVGKEAHIDLWVGKDDHRVYQVSIAPITIDDQASDSNVTISFVATYGDYGKTMSIVAPAGAEPLQQITQGLFGGLVSLSAKK
jgi:hypothetical protein